MKFSVNRFRLRRNSPVVVPANGTGTVRNASASAPSNDHLIETEDDGFGAEPFATAKGDAGLPPASPSTAAAIDAIRAEGLTLRQLRLARRVSQKHNLPATSDFDAVRLLRQAGIDPFQRSELLELVQSDGADPIGTRALTRTEPARTTLPQTARPVPLPAPDQRADQGRLAELLEVQRGIARRRRRKSLLLAARLFVFVVVPTFAAGYYFYGIATPLYATKSEFVIQQADASGGGMAGLFRGTQIATAQDSIAVQGYLQSREAMLRLDAEYGFRAHFSDPDIDAIQRLDPQGTQEAAYSVYARNVSISYDPTEGIIKMEVSATTPETSARFAEALIGYAEEQVDHLTQRLREDQMQGARESYDEAEANMLTSQEQLVNLQQTLKVLNTKVEEQLIAGQVAQLETQLTTERLSLEQMMSNETPNEARMAPIVQRIAILEAEINSLRSKLTEDSAQGTSLAKVQSELIIAEANVETRLMLLAQSLQAMETARIEANRQVRYLSVSVKPTMPDEASYPRAFENTMVALLLFGGIYLMLAMTAEILREQISA